MSRRGRVVSALAVALLAAGAAWSVPGVGASFTGSAGSAPQSASTIALDPLDDVTAERDADGHATAAWSVPAQRSDVATSYEVERLVDGVAETIAPEVVATGGTASFGDDLRVPSTITSVTQIGATTLTTCVVANGAASCWGTNTYGQLGDGSTTDSRTPVAVSTAGALAGRTVTDVAVGNASTCAVADGAVFCWGYNGTGQLGNGSTVRSTTPVAVSTAGALAGRTVTDVAVGNGFACAVADGAVFCWGDNAYGQLGNGSTVRSTTPVAVSTAGGLGGKTAARVVAVDSSTCAVADGAAYCWGRNNVGQLGDGTSTDRHLPVAVSTADALNGKTITDIAVGRSETCVVADGAAYCWGWNNLGQLGDGTTTQRLTPVAVSTAGGLGGKTVTRVAAAQYSACVIADGAAYCWGYNISGQLGDGTTTTSPVPVPVSTGGDLTGPVTDIATAGSTSNSGFGCAVADGAVFCWGDNIYGQLGNGSTAQSSTPVAVSTDGVLRRVTCAPGWTLVSDDTLCLPGEDVTVGYRIAYRKAGWSSPAVEAAAPQVVP